MRPGKFIWLILLLAFILRIVYLGHFPLGFTADEASQGYAAYSLLKTGKDEWGIPLPITSFRAFADYRAPLQTYLIIPSVALFGLSEFSIRLPSAIIGTLAVLAIYLLASVIFLDRKKVPLLAAFLLAISPWHIQFSRTALEANYASFFFPLGLYFLLRGMKKDPRSLIFSAILFGFDLYSYLAAKLFVPLFLALFTLLNFKRIKATFSRFIPFVLIFLFFLTPIYVDTFFGPGNVRGKDLAITNFSQGDLQHISNDQYYSALNHISPVLPRIFSNKLTYAFQSFVTNYVSYLSPAFWFTEGGREITYSVFPGFGLLYLFMLPIVLYGFYSLVKINHPSKKIIFAWLLLGIIPAAITKDGYRPNRAGSLLTLMELVAAFGFYESLKLIPAKWRSVAKLISLAIVSVSLIFYLNLYYFVSPVKYPDALSFGYRDLITKINALQGFDKVIFDRGGQSQVFVAFYTKMNPAFYQTFSKEWWPVIQKENLLFLDMIPKYDLGKFTFTSFDASRDLRPGNLCVVRSDRFDPGLAPNVIDKVDYPDGTPAFYLLTYVKK